MKLQVITISVSDLTHSRAFYEEILGFEPDIAYEKWQSYKVEGDGGFGIIEEPGLQREPSEDIINFRVERVEGYWERVKDSVEVEAPLATTAWGTYKFVIRDPDGFRLGFVGR